MSKPVATTDVVQPGDVLEVALATGLETAEVPRYKLRVADDGSIHVPLVGPVRVAGLTLADADFQIYRASVDRGIYRHPNVSVAMAAR
ncbi:MAG: polysaccharide biosynthesis/export family protein, partial [Planctomycetales bacterium]|nr:polysaccharide biosynthesis/export family protein [Planctomycetales bacterium]